MSNQPSAAIGDVRPAGSQAPSLITPTWRWGLCLFLAAVAGWVLLNYTPIQFETPEALRSVDNYSPPELQRAAAESSVKLYWQNSLIQFALVGLSFSAVALLASVGYRKAWLGIVLGSLAGVVCGVLIVVLGTYLRRHFDSDVPLPLVGEDTRLLVTDIGVYALTSVLLVLPISLFAVIGGGMKQLQTALSVILAALVTGMVTPLVGSAVFPTAQTNIFPPEGPGLTAIWLTILVGLVFAFTTFTGTRSSGTRTGGHEGTA